MTAKKRIRNILSWVGKILIGIFILLFGLVVIGWVRESIARDKYHAQYPAPGKMVSVNNHDIHLHCVGVGTPLVVFESDLDQYGSLSWNSVQGEIGELTRACSYDRAGIMWSEPGPRPRDGATIAAELKTVLENAAEQGPYILVAHAFGGAYARIFAGQNPDDVCGMVLVESSHPEMFARFEQYGVEPEIPDKQIRPLILFLSHLGSPGRYKGNVYDLPPEIYDPIQAFLPES
ncbi:MAG: alpha/beta hydrolase, partial [Anaerolineales bacterium]